VVKVVDSRSTAMGLGFAVLAAADEARGGGDLDSVRLAAEASATRTTTLFYVDTLEHLRRGGRIGAAAALIGTALAVKPILEMADGVVVVKEKVRTASRALARLEALAVEAAGDGPVDIAIHHLDAPERAEDLRAHLAADLAGRGRLVVSEVGAAVGAHVGPGIVGVVVVPRG
jgi:DegV family protein with EDD domain